MILSFANHIIMHLDLLLRQKLQIELKDRLYVILVVLFHHTCKKVSPLDYKMSGFEAYLGGGIKASLWVLQVLDHFGKSVYKCSEIARR